MEELEKYEASKVTLQRLHEPDEAGVVLSFATKRGRKHEFTITLSKARDFAADLTALVGKAR
jgi:hypothetical protein